MRIAEGFAVLELKSRAGMIYPVLCWSSSSVCLIDTGYKGMLPDLKEAMAAEGIPFERLTHVILTHHDRDHSGCVSAIKEASSNRVTVCAHAAEMPYLTGKLLMKKIKPAYLEKMLLGLSPAEQAKLLQDYSTPLDLPVDQTLAENDTLPGCPDVSVIHTPGHTPGHICLYHRPTRTLVAGDMMIIEDRRMDGPVYDVTENMELANLSLQRLLRIKIDTVICYHGGLMFDAQKRVAEIIREGGI